MPIVLDLKILADGGVWVRNKDARIETSADLLLAGTVAEPELSGRISAIEGGLFRFRDVTYTIIGGEHRGRPPRADVRGHPARLRAVLQAGLRSHVRATAPAA